MEKISYLKKLIYLYFLLKKNRLIFYRIKWLNMNYCTVIGNSEHLKCEV